MKGHKRTMSPLSFVTNPFFSIPTIATLSGSIPFSIDDKPIRQYKTLDHQKIDKNDLNTYKPKANGIHIDIILQQAIYSGWLTKHKKLAFSFIRSHKRRYVVLVDRMLYTFKTETPNTYRECFELTKDTHAYLSDMIPGVSYCIEIRKPKVGEGNDVWFLQIPDAETMKIWLSYIKRVIAWLKAGNEGHITKKCLDMIMVEEYSQLSLKKRLRTGISNIKASSFDVIFPYRKLYDLSGSSLSINTSCSDKARSKSIIDVAISGCALNYTTCMTDLPPQPPPPTSLPPPIPLI